MQVLGLCDPFVLLLIGLLQLSPVLDDRREEPYYTALLLTRFRRPVTGMRGQALTLTGPTR